MFFRFLVNFLLFLTCRRIFHQPWTSSCRFYDHWWQLGFKSEIVNFWILIFEIFRIYRFQICRFHVGEDYINLGRFFAGFPAPLGILTWIDIICVYITFFFAKNDGETKVSEHSCGISNPWWQSNTGPCLGYQISDFRLQQNKYSINPGPEFLQFFQSLMAK